MQSVTIRTAFRVGKFPANLLFHNQNGKVDGLKKPMWAASAQAANPKIPLRCGNFFVRTKCVLHIPEYAAFQAA